MGEDNFVALLLTMTCSIYKLGVEFRKGINSAPVGQLLRKPDDGGIGLNGEAIIQRLVDVLLLRWDQSFFKDKSSYLYTAIMMHALARDPANIPHLSRCQALLRDIVFSKAPAGIFIIIIFFYIIYYIYKP
jgi:hypothetical protein